MYQGFYQTNAIRGIMLKRNSFYLNNSSFALFLSVDVSTQNNSDESTNKMTQ